MMADMIWNKELNAKYKEQAKELVSQLTLHEKALQLQNWAPAVERLGIPAYNYWNEALHGVARAGVATVFPQAITTAAAFDEDLMEELGDVISTEGRAKYNNQISHNDTDIYKGLTFWSPNVNIFRDPRWGRGHETYGEDPYLTSRLGVRFIKGLQGHDEKYMKAAGCAKHFAVHSGPEDQRHYFNAEASAQDMRETYLPAFEACVKEAGVEAVMGAYNRTNGEPCCGSKTLLKDILRDEWGFEGHVTSDCWAIKDFYEGHAVVDTAEQAVALALTNGCDVNCGNLYPLAEKAVNEGLLKEEILDEALVNIYTTRFKLGILGDAKDCPFNDIDFLECDSAAHRAFNLKVALSSITMLKNDGTLPLNKGELKNVAVIGPNANSRRALVGNYEGTASRYITALEGIQDYLGDDVRVLFSEGCHLYKDRIENLGVANDRLSEVQGICERSDAVILCLGLDSGLEGEEGDEGNQYASGDKPNLDLPGIQQQILEATVASGKPVILVLFGGSALAVKYAQEHCAAVVWAGYPGAQGGKALAQILFGANSPQGKLPITFYNDTKDLPDFTDYSMKGRTYRYMTSEPLYPFGYGLSYAKTEVKDVKLSDTKVNDGIKITFDVANDGKWDAGEAVQVYVKAERPGTPNPTLKGIKKLQIPAGGCVSGEIMLSADAFALYNEAGEKEILPGEYSVYVGTQQPDARSAALTGKSVAKFTVTI